MVLRPCDMKSAIELLDDPNCRIAPLVRRLVLKEFGIFYYLPTEEIPLLMALLPSVKTLRLSNFVLRNPSLDATLFEHFQGITHLEVDTLKTRDFSQLLDILCGFPLLESISFSGCDYHRDLSGSPNYLPQLILESASSLRVHLHRLDSFYLNDIGRWLFAQSAPIRLQTFRCVVGDTVALPTSKKLFREYGGTIERLQLQFPHPSMSHVTSIERRYLFQTMFSF
jgi:hypothetical protein